MELNCCLVLVTILLQTRFPNANAAPRQAEELYGQHANYAPVYRQEAPQSISLTQTAVYSPRYSQGNIIVESSEECECPDDEDETNPDCNRCNPPCQQPVHHRTQPEACHQCPETCHHSQPEICPHARSETCSEPKPETCQRSHLAQRCQPELCSQPKPEKCCHRPETCPTQLEVCPRCSSCDEEELVRAANIERIEELVATYIADYLINQLVEDNINGCSKSDDAVRVLDADIYTKCQEQLCERSRERCCEAKGGSSAVHDGSSRCPRIRGKRDETETCRNYSASCSATELDLLTGVEGFRSPYGCSLTEI